MRRDRQRGDVIVLELRAHRQRVVATLVISCRDALTQQVSVERDEIGHTRNWRGPLTLKVSNAILDTWLLGRSGRQAEPRGKHIVARQRREARVECALSSFLDVDRDGLGVVPPQLAWHPPEEVERFDQALKDGLGPLGGKRDGEGAVGVTPSRDEDTHLSPAVGEVHTDVSEVRFKPLTGCVIEWDECLALVESPLLEVSLDRVVAAGVAVFGDESPVDLTGGVPLLGWRGEILRQDVIDNVSDGIEDSRWSRLVERVGFGLGIGQRFENGLGRVTEPTRNGADGLTVTPGLSDLCEVVHREHPPPPTRAGLCTRPMSEAVLRCLPVQS